MPGGMVESIVPPSPEVHAPARQTWPAAHSMPQPPQCWVLVWVA